MQELAHWLSAPDTQTFPYDAVVAEFHRVGKHFVSRELLDDLDRARAAAPGTPLARFLDVALDKHDGVYDNPSYLAIDLLLKWRQSHFRLAMKMLGHRSGTGYTEGVPYLERARAIPVFAPV